MPSIRARSGQGELGVSSFRCAAWRDHAHTLEAIAAALSTPVSLQARTLRTTNPMENLIGLVQIYTHNVKQWRASEMTQRWVCAALLEPAQNFRWVRGHRHMHITCCYS